MTQNAAEIWKPILGFEGIYEVSNYGLIRSFHHKPPRLMKVRMHKTYLSLVLRDREGRRTHTTVHQCVARAFHPNPEGLPEIDHKDTNKLNNQWDNLEWVTGEENRRRAERAGLLLLGEKAPASKLTDEKVRMIRAMVGSKTHREMAEIFKVTPLSIYNVIHRKTWGHVSL